MRIHLTDFFYLIFELRVIRLEPGDVFSLVFSDERGFDIFAFCLFLLFGLVAQLTFQLYYGKSLFCVKRSLLVQLLRKIHCTKLIESLVCLKFPCRLSHSKILNRRQRLSRKAMMNKLRIRDKFVCRGCTIR